MKDNVYLAGFLSAAVVLILVGWEQLPSSTLLTWALTFGATTSVAVLAVALYRVQMQLKESRNLLARQEAEIHFAREVQLALFPRRMPECQGLEIRAVCKPARGASGDYYDVISIQGRGLIFAVADISGKGISAAILMANLQALLRNVAESELSLARICEKLNTHLYQVTESNRFSTFFLAEWQPDRHLLTYVNAGHLPPVLKGSIERIRLEAGGPPLGLFDGIEYQSGEIEIKVGDLMVLFSDGLIEASSDQDEEFGEGRLEQIINGHQDAELAELEGRILTEVTEWSRDDLQDDLTLLLVRARQENCRP